MRSIAQLGAIAVMATAAAMGNLAAMASPMPGQGTWETTLQGRDLDRNGVTDAFYDTDLDITWLRNAEISGTYWHTAVSWADGLTFGGYTDWRLPKTDTCKLYNCIGSEMGHLWYVELGNTAGWGLTMNTGDFQNLQPGFYWSGMKYAPDPRYAWFFGPIAGYQDVCLEAACQASAIAVRPGDVAAIPEPGTYALMLVGLGVVGALVRRRKV